MYIQGIFAYKLCCKFQKKLTFTSHRMDSSWWWGLQHLQSTYKKRKEGKVSKCSSKEKKGEWSNEERRSWGGSSLWHYPEQTTPFNLHKEIAASGLCYHQAGGWKRLEVTQYNYQQVDKWVIFHFILQTWSDLSQILLLVNICVFIFKTKIFYKFRMPYIVNNDDWRQNAIFYRLICNYTIILHLLFQWYKTQFSRIWQHCWPTTGPWKVRLSFSLLFFPWEKFPAGVIACQSEVVPGN